MSAAILFEETQGVGSKALRDFCKVTSLLVLLAVAVSLFLSGGRATNTVSVLLAVLALPALGFVISSFRLETQVRTDGIYVRYRPFQRHYTGFAWTHIEQVYLREYNGLTEYGGWGIKIGVSGISYTAGGRQGIQLKLRDGRAVLIGTRQPEAVAKVLRAVR